MTGIVHAVVAADGELDPLDEEVGDDGDGVAEPHAEAPTMQVARNVE